MANDVKVGKVEVNLDTLKGVSRFNVDKMFSHKSDAWVDELWSHLEKINPSKEEEPIKKKKKKTKEGEE